MSVNNKFKKLRNTILVLLLYFILPIFLTICIESIGINYNTTFMKQIVLIIANILTLFVFLLIFKNKLKEEFSVFAHSWKDNIRLGIKYWLFGFAFMIISNFIIIILLNNPIASNEQGNRDILTSAPLYSIFAMCFSAPIIEEIVFRLNFRQLISNNKLFIIITGFLFAFLHIFSSITSLISFVYIFPYLGLGIAFAYIYVKTKTIWTTIFIHIFHNAIIVLLLLIGG